MPNILLNVETVEGYKQRIAELEAKHKQYQALVDAAVQYVLGKAVWPKNPQEGTIEYNALHDAIQPFLATEYRKKHGREDAN